MNTMRRVGMLVAVTVVAWTIPTGSDGQERKYSGSVLSVDRSAGVIVAGDMGPWRIKDGVTQVDCRSESVLPGWHVKPGDCVTVIVTAGDKPPTAIRISIWEPTEG